MDSFVFQGKTYDYIDMSPNQTRVNERRVELALGMDFLRRFDASKVLEVGNVTKHYMDHGASAHTVLDRDEHVPWLPGIIHEDVLAWQPRKRYKAVLSISTVEHTVDPLQAVRRIMRFAEHVLITVPFGYAGSGAIFDAFTHRLSYLKRINDDNEWVQASRDEVKGVKYNTPFPFANAIMVVTR